MNEKLRCRVCGTDYSYTDAKFIHCDVCEDDVSTIDMKVILPEARTNEQADPLEGM
ncbi:hypothetical protein [Tardiphaga sp.]|jgi:hypothetical protein|uniref:hypothetical protein n=1 Tax=Tardiphaga sp. TaxID=1926292 RepID=UPI0037DA529A